jgi:hypothetical protein
MAGTLLHVTLAMRAADAVRDRSSRAIALHHPHDYALGAILFDLPYFDRLLRTALVLATGRPLHFHPFGMALHRRSPAGFLLALLDLARSDAEKALCFGALTHYAVDLVFHPEIERRLGPSKRHSDDPDGLHKHLEDQIDLHCHYHLVGTSGLGTAYVRRAFTLEPCSDWVKIARAAMRRVHAEVPTANELVAWRAQLLLYGLTSAWRKAPWISVLPEDDPDLLDCSIALAEEAIRVSALYIDKGALYLAGSLDRDGFLSEVPDRSALDGEEALPSAVG